MRRSNRFVPLFNDKHLSYRWDWAKEMYDTAKELKIPFRAGSSVPLAPRVPPLELPDGRRSRRRCASTAAPPDAYGFHGLEVLQSLVETRKGGETGIGQVEFVRGKDLLKAGRGGPVLARVGGGRAGRRSRAQQGQSSTRTTSASARHPADVQGRLAGGGAERGQDDGVPLGVRVPAEGRGAAPRLPVRLPLERPHLFFRAGPRGAAPVPARRSAVPRRAHAADDGRCRGGDAARAAGKALATPHLEFAYAPKDFRAFRENGESLKLVGEELPGINPIGRKK